MAGTTPDAPVPVLCLPAAAGTAPSMEGNQLRSLHKIVSATQYVVEARTRAHMATKIATAEEQSFGSLLAVRSLHGPPTPSCLLHQAMLKNIQLAIGGTPR